jgi:hypothetical protein
MTIHLSNADAWGLAWEGRGGHAYDESAFRYLLERERQRSAQLGVPPLLLLVELSPSPTPSRFRVDTAARIFSVLARCVRETDIMGWYRHDRVAGIVFTEVGPRPLAEVSDLFRSRVVAALDRARSRAIAGRVTVRLHRSPRSTSWVRGSTHREEDEC